MNGAPWGWIALIGAVAVLFTASNYDQSGSNKVATVLRKELTTTASERDRSIKERDQARSQADEFIALAGTLDSNLAQTQAELRTLKSERDKLRKELASASQDRTQLQQTVASLQLERSQTKRNVEQLRQGLQQLLSQTETVARILAEPPPGFAQIDFVEMQAQPLTPVKPEKKSTDARTYYPEEPLNEAQ